MESGRWNGLTNDETKRRMTVRKGKSEYEKESNSGSIDDEHDNGQPPDSLRGARDHGGWDGL